MKKNHWIALALTAVAALALPHLLLLSTDVTHSFAYVLGAALVFDATARMLAVQEKRLRRYALGVGFAFALCQLAGWRLDAADTLGGLMPAVLLLASSIALAPACGYGFALLARVCLKKTDDEPCHGKRVFFGSFVFILLCWLPVFLAYYPGMFNYDSTGEIAQIVSNTYDGNFPIVHTLLLGAFYRLGEALGSYNTGIALYTIAQCAATAAGMAYAVCYAYSLRCPRWVWMGMAAVYALLPTHSMMAMCTTKDLFFCAALMVLTVRLHALWRSPEKWRNPAQWLCVAALCAALCFMRTNGVFSLLAVALAAIPWMRQNRAALVRLLTALLAGMVVLGAVTSGLNSIYHPRRGGVREWLSVPLMQVARVHYKAAEEGRDLPEKAEIEQFIPQADRYQRHLADGVKRHAQVGVSNMPEYLNLWGRLFVQHPADFFDAFAYLTKSYWHLDDETHLDIYAERGEHGYLETKNQDGLGVTRDSKCPGLMQKLDDLFVANDYRRIPILATVVEPGFWCWAAALVMLLAAYRRDRGTLLCAMLITGLFASMLLGPCSYIRYAYPMVISVPLLWAAHVGREE